MPRWNYKDYKERFWIKVNKNGVLMPNMDTSCWDWIGGLQTDGYGTLGMKVNDRWACWPAHRVSWLIHYGEVPKYPEKEICHKCDNRACVNPEHLYIATHKENILDMFRKGRSYDKHGEKSPSSKLTKDEVIKIRYLYAWTRTTYADLGRMFGVTGEHISSIINRKSWDHI